MATITRWFYIILGLVLTLFVLPTFGLSLVPGVVCIYWGLKGKTFMDE